MPILDRIPPALRSPRALNLAAAALGVAMLVYAAYAQFGQGFEPCPLCILQRLALAGVVLVLFGAGVHGATGRARFVWAGSSVVAAGIGFALAARHVWLQHLPPDLVPACGPGLNYLVEVLPLWDALAEALHGSGECAKVDWTLLGLSMPEWNLAAFAAFGVGGFWNNARRA